MEAILELLKEQTASMNQEESISFVDAFGENELTESFISEKYGEEILSEFIVKRIK